MDFFLLKNLFDLIFVLNFLFHRLNKKLFFDLEVKVSVLKKILEILKKKNCTKNNFLDFKKNCTKKYFSSELKKKNVVLKNIF